jgi:hypothetical protein
MYFVPMMWTSVRPMGGGAAAGVVGACSADALASVLVAMASSELEAESMTIALLAAVDTVEEPSAAEGEDEASTRANAGRTTETQIAAKRKTPIPIPDNVMMLFLIRLTTYY